MDLFSFVYERKKKRAAVWVKHYSPSYGLLPILKAVLGKKTKSTNKQALRYVVDCEIADSLCSTGAFFLGLVQVSEGAVLCRWC